VNSLYSNTTGSYNTAFGNAALNANTTGTYNNAHGKNSLFKNTTGSYNTAYGDAALYTTTTGNYNTALGSAAGGLNSTGSGNVFIGYTAGYNETGSNKLYIDNSDTSSPLIYGDFATNAVTINGNLTTTGTVTSNSMTSLDGTKMVSIDDNGDVHIGNNSMVFTNAENSNGVDVMSSTIGKVQIGESTTDTTTVVGALNVQEPTEDSHAATRAYVDKVGALAAVLDTRLPAGGKSNRLSINTAVIHNKAAIGLSLVGIVKRDSGRLLDYSVGFATSSGESMSKMSLGISF
jgi:hypothetical protein